MASAPKSVETKHTPGHVVRKARKSHRCANAARAERGLEWASQCSRVIAPGDSYLQGDPDPYKAGGFGHEIFCMSCAERGLA